MDFYKELLESFSRVKGRKLKLLEGFEERSSAAAEEINKAFPQIATGRTATNVGVHKLEVTIGKGRGPGIFSITIPGAWAAVSVDQDGKLIGTSRAVKSAHTRLLGKEGVAAPSTKGKPLTPEQIKAEEERIKAEKEQREREARYKSMLGSSMYDLEPDVVEGIIKDVGEFETTVRKLLCNDDGTINSDYFTEVQPSLDPGQLNTEAGQKRWDSCEHHLQYLTGNQRGNIERQLVNESPVLEFDGATQEYVVGGVAASPADAQKVAEALVKLANAATTGSKTPDEDLCKQFQVTEGGGVSGVTVYVESVEGTSYWQRGKVFNNVAAARSLKGLMALAGCSTDSMSARKALGMAGGSIPKENHIRGTLGELAKVAGSHYANLSRFRKGEEIEGVPQLRSLPPTKRPPLAAQLGTSQSIALRKLAFDSMNEVLHEIGRLGEEREKWIFAAQGALVNQEEQAFIESLGFFDDTEKTKRFVRAILHMSKTTYKLRRPLLVVKVADEVGKGNKQDVLECWGSRDEALAGLQRSEKYGGGKSKITKNMIGERKVSDIFKGKEDLLEQYRAAKILERPVAGQPEQMLYSAEISLKTLLSISSAKQGETTQNDISNSIHELGDVADPRWANLIGGRKDKVNGVEGPTHRDPLAANDVAGIKSLQKLSDGIKRSIDALKFKTTIRPEKGEAISVDSLKIYAEALIKSFEKNSKYRDILGDKDHQTLTAYIKNMQGTGKLTSEDFETRVREKLFKMTLFTTLNKKAKPVTKDNKPTKDAQQAMLYSLALYNQAGGASRDGTLLQVDDLSNLISYVSTQNGEMWEVLKSIRAGDGKWAFEASHGSLTFSRVNDATDEDIAEAKELVEKAKTDDERKAATNDLARLVRWQKNPQSSNRSIKVTYEDGKWLAHRSATSVKKASNAIKFDVPEDLEEQEKSKKESTLGGIMDTLLEVIGALKGKISVRDLQKII